MRLFSDTCFSCITLLFQSFCSSHVFHDSGLLVVSWHSRNLFLFLLFQFLNLCYFKLRNISLLCNYLLVLVYSQLKVLKKIFLCSSIQFSSVTQLCPTLCNPMNRSTPGLPVHHHLPGFTQTHFHRVHDAIHPSHPLSSPSPPAPNPSQHQGLFK